MMQRYLVTGAAGNLARQLVTELIAAGKEVLQLDLAAAPAGVPKARFISCDITDRARVRSALDDFRPDCILHMASMLSRSSEQDPERAWEVNATATKSLLLDAAERRVSRVFFPSTLATYAGDIPDPMPEDYPQWPTIIYGATKVAAERMGVYLHDRAGLDFRAVRLPFVLSPYAPAGAATAYASNAFVAAARGEVFVFPVAPEAGASSIYVRDVTTGILQLMDADAAHLTRRVYNLHSFAPNAQQIASAISARMPGFEYRFEPDTLATQMVMSMPDVVVDDSARRDWGWAPAYDIEATADDMLKTLSAA